MAFREFEGFTEVVGDGPRSLSDPMAVPTTLVGGINVERAGPLVRLVAWDEAPNTGGTVVSRWALTREAARHLLTQLQKILPGRGH